MVFLGVSEPNPIHLLCQLRVRSGLENVKAAIIRSEDELGSLRDLTDCMSKDAFGRFKSAFRLDEDHSDQRHEVTTVLYGNAKA